MISFLKIVEDDWGVTDLQEFVFGHLPSGQFRKICIKPNWVKHQESAHFPIDGLVTSSSLIEAVVMACLERYVGIESIVIGDVPLQSCNWVQLEYQAGIRRLKQQFARLKSPSIEFLDLRRERYSQKGGFLEKSLHGEFGDPLGYHDVVVDNSSFLDEISHQKNLFRVSDYDAEETISSHRIGFHKYVVAGSILDSDLLINLPKMKTHQKSGITGALKNLVGINGAKAYLVHYKQGKPDSGGDEFPSDVRYPVVIQSRIRELTQKRAKTIYKVLRQPWRLVKRLYGIETEGTLENLGKSFYVAGGSWYGNDTIWRMVYDLNKIIRYAGRDGSYPHRTPQREYIAFLDGIVAGEGNGPLQPIPVNANLLACSDDPFALDIVAAKLMGFDYKKIPMLRNHQMFGDSSWGRLDPENLEYDFNGERNKGVSSLPVLRHFLPAPGWKGHIELL